MEGDYDLNGLSVNHANLLVNAGIKTRKQMQDNLKNLLSFRGIGKASAWEIFLWCQDGDIRKKMVPYFKLK